MDEYFFAAFGRFVRMFGVKLVKLYFAVLIRDFCLKRREKWRPYWKKTLAGCSLEYTARSFSEVVV